MYKEGWLIHRVNWGNYRLLKYSKWEANCKQIGGGKLKTNKRQMEHTNRRHMGNNQGGKAKQMETSGRQMGVTLKTNGREMESKWETKKGKQMDNKWETNPGTLSEPCSRMGKEGEEVAPAPCP